MMVTIYMPLLNEGVDVWRPVQATYLGGNRYRVESDTWADEEWAFATGSIVNCELRTFANGKRGLAAVEAVED